MYIAVDVSSILWTALKVGKDVEGTVDENGVHCNSAAYGYENAINSMVRVLGELDAVPSQLILVEEGYNSKSPRLNIDPSYKATRGKKSKLEYENFNEMKKMFLSALKGVGALVIRQDGAEADDALGWLSLHTTEELVVVTNDNDLSALNSRLVTVRVNSIMGRNKYGEWPCKYITLYKSLVGDSSDNIGGIRGFGPKAWDQVVSRFGTAGMDVLVKCALDCSVESLKEDAAKDKLVEKIYSGGADFIRSYKLARIYPEWCDTSANPIQYEPGMVSSTRDERLQRWSAQKRLITYDKWEAFKPWMLEQCNKSKGWTALDIETSTCDISDAWVENSKSKTGKKAVDNIGSQLSGMSLTAGNNHQYTVYIPVDHKDTHCVPSEVLKYFIIELLSTGITPVIHNVMFEATVLWNEWGYLLPRWADTIFEASYVAEEGDLGLKELSKKWLDYKQSSYADTTTIDGVQYRMRDLTAEHVFNYTCDDTITASALHNFFQTVLMLEGTNKILDQVEYDASRLHVWAYITGTRVDLDKLEELKKEDAADREKAQQVLDSYLTEIGWAGSVCPQWEEPPSAADIKEVCKIVTGTELNTRIRTPEKLLTMIEDAALAAALQVALEGEFDKLNALVKSKYDCKPVFNIGSYLQLQKLFYEAMQMPVELRNFPTDVMKAKGLREGTARTDALAITYMLLRASPREAEALNAVRELKMFHTRFSLYYEPLPKFVHWKTGKVHSNHLQCSTTTRRASSSRPNLQQLSKAEKLEGYSPRIRELYIPHKEGAIIVSLDFSSQEVLLYGELSKDPVLRGCFVGDVLTDMHSKTGCAIHNNREPETPLTYEEFVELVKAGDGKAKKYRALGKLVNFSTQFRIGAKTLSEKLLVVESEAQSMIDAKAEVFCVAEQWALDQMAEVRRTGQAKTMLGAIRHLRDNLNSPDKGVANKAERQGLSIMIQGSAAEQTKLVEGAVWNAGILDRYDCSYIASIHDEIVTSVMLDQAEAFIGELHGLMTQDYAGMELPIRSSVSVGWNFGVQKELNGDHTEKNIRKALGLATLAV